jgi:hypothetical protein
VVGVPSGRFDQHDLGGPIGIAPAPDHAAGEEFARGTERRFAGFFLPRVDMTKRSSICFHPARPAAFIARRGLHRAAWDQGVEVHGEAAPARYPEVVRFFDERRDCGVQASSFGARTQVRG